MPPEINSTSLSETDKRYRKIRERERNRGQISPEVKALNQANHTIWEMNNLKVLNSNRSSAFLATKAAELAQKRNSIFEQYPYIQTVLLKEDLDNKEKILNKDISSKSFKMDGTIKDKVSIEKKEVNSQSYPDKKEIENTEKLLNKDIPNISFKFDEN